MSKYLDPDHASHKAELIAKTRAELRAKAESGRGLFDEPKKKIIITLETIVHWFYTPWITVPFWVIGFSFLHPVTFKGIRTNPNFEQMARIYLPIFLFIFSVYIWQLKKQNRFLYGVLECLIGGLLSYKFVMDYVDIQEYSTTLIIALGGSVVAFSKGIENMAEAHSIKKYQRMHNATLTAPSTPGSSPTSGPS